MYYHEHRDDLDTMSQAEEQLDCEAIDALEYGFIMGYMEA